MDISAIELFIPNIAAYFNVDPATILLLVAVVCTVANLVSRLIPDDAVGFLGFVRKVCSILGVYASNRVTAGISTNDVIKKVVGADITREAENVILEAASDAHALIPEVLADGTDLVSQPFPGLPSLGPDGKFLKKGEME